MNDSGKWNSPGGNARLPYGDRLSDDLLDELTYSSHHAPRDVAASRRARGLLLSALLKIS